MPLQRLYSAYRWEKTLEREGLEPSTPAL